MPLSVEETFGETLRKLRKEKGLSQEELAHESGLDRTFISLLERGKRQPSLGTMINLSEALGITASNLIFNIEEKIKANKPNKK